jgi:hypothetical protein
MIVIGDLLCKVLAKYSHASAKSLLRHFAMSASTVKEMPICALRSKKYIRRWVPHLLDPAQKKYCRLSAIKLLKILWGRRAIQSQWDDNRR